MREYNMISLKDKLKEMGEESYNHAKVFSSVNYYNDFINILNNFKGSNHNEKK